jgi:translocator protein
MTMNALSSGMPAPSLGETATPLIPALGGRSLVYLAMALASVAAASWLGSAATTPQIPTWYAALNKPWFNPPTWVFPVAWTSLFALMAFGFWRILRQEAAGPDRGVAILFYLVQIAINISWSWAFFGARSPLAGLCVAVLLVLAVLLMLVSFRRIDPLAGWLQLPYLGWVSFALFLNFTIWRMN